jgi:hypothetical protein
VASLRKRSNGHWQARVRKVNQTITKTFINKFDAERRAKQTEVELDKGSFVNLDLAERTTFAEIKRTLRSTKPRWQRSTQNSPWRNTRPIVRFERAPLALENPNSNKSSAID